jgi:tape measure domain-containing protein
MSDSIGWATLSVVPGMAGFGAALSKGVEPELAVASRSIGERMSSGIFDVVKKGAVVTGVAIAGAIGTALVTGWGRLTSIENATAKLYGLGNSGVAVKTIMNDALVSVKGTAFGLDAAASVAAGAVAAGIKPGLELRRILGLVADGSTIAGVSMGEMGSIFNKVAAANKIQGDTIAQLNDAGIPIVQMLGKVMGKTSEQVTAMAAKGQIDFPTFAKAMEEGLGGAALKSGDTTEGAFANMGAAASRFGAGLLVDVFPVAKQVFGGITSWLDDLTVKAAPFATAFGTALTGFITGFQDGTGWGGRFRDVLTAIWEKGIVPVANFITGTAVPAVQNFVQGFRDGTGWGGRFRDILVFIHDKAIVPIGDFLTKTAVPAIQNFVQGFRDGEGPGGTFRDILAGIYTDGIKPIGDKVAAAGTAIQSFVQGFKDGTGPGGTFKDILKQVYEQGIKPLWAIITDNLVPALKSFETTWILGPGGTAVQSLFKSCMELAVPIAALAAGVLKLVGPMLDRLAPVLNVVAWILTNVIVPAFAAFADETLVVCGYVATGAKYIGDAWTWASTALQPVITAIGGLFVGLWNNFLQPAVSWIVGGIASVMTWFGNMLVALSNVPTFGWAKDAGDKVLAAAGQVAGLSGQIRAIPDGHSDISINVTANYSAAAAAALGAQRAGIKLNLNVPGNAAGGTYAPTPGGTIVRVAEAGRRETVVDTETLNAAMAQRANARDISGSGSPNGPVTIHLYDKDNVLIGTMQGVFAKESANLARQKGRATR